MVDVGNSNDLWTIQNCEWAIEIEQCDDYADYDYNYDSTMDYADYDYNYDSTMDYADPTVYADSAAYTDYGTTDYYNEIWWADSSWNFCTS